MTKTERSTFRAKFGFLAAMTSMIAGPAAMYIIPFRAINYGGGAFWIWFIIGYLAIVIPLYIVEAGFGLWSRKASPQTWRMITNGSRFFTAVSWAAVISLFFASVYVLTGFVGSGVIYLIGTPFQFWGPHPTGFFWGTYTSSFWLLALSPVLWFVTWLFTYKSINSWAKALIWFKPIGTVLMAVVLVWTLLNFQVWPQGWAMTFDFRPASLLSFALISQALLWGFFRSSAGQGTGTVFASYLPRSGDVNDTVTLAGLWDLLFIVMVGLWIPVLALGVGIPPSFGGAIGLVFSALPNAWNATVPIGGLGIAGLVYVLVIIGGYPTLVVIFEYVASALMDEFGLTRTKTITMLTIVGFLASLLYTIPAVDPLNGEGWGWTMIFGALYWSAIFSLVAALFEYVMLFRHFKFNRLQELVNSASLFKIGNKFKYLLYFGFILTAVTVIYLLVGTTGLIPGLSSGDFGALLGDGTVGWGLSAPGLAILGTFFGVPVLIAIVITLRGASMGLDKK